MGYDLDAIECLDRGEEPACHEAAGFDAIFAHAPFTPDEQQACTGHRAWLAQLPGFIKPPSLSESNPAN